jgi:hypothetical protein
MLSRSHQNQGCVWHDMRQTSEAHLVASKQVRSHTNSLLRRLTLATQPRMAASFRKSCVAQTCPVRCCGCGTCMQRPRSAAGISPMIRSSASLCALRPVATRQFVPPSRREIQKHASPCLHCHCSLLLQAEGPPSAVCSGCCLYGRSP